MGKRSWKWKQPLGPQLSKGRKQAGKKTPTKLINCKHVPFPMEKEGQLRRQSQDPGRRMKSQEEEQLTEQLYCGLGVWVPPKSLCGSPNPQWGSVWLWEVTGFVGGHGDGAPMMRWGPHKGTKRLELTLLLSLSCENVIYQKIAICNHERVPTRHRICGWLDLDFLPPELWGCEWKYLLWWHTLPSMFPTWGR